MNQEEYRRYLLTPEWQTRRRRILARAKGRCEICEIVGRLEVHHRTYEHVGNEPDNDLIAICGECHKEEHGLNPEETSEAVRHRRDFIKATRLATTPEVRDRLLAGESIPVSLLDPHWLRRYGV